MDRHLPLIFLLVLAGCGGGSEFSRACTNFVSADPDATQTDTKSMCTCLEARTDDLDAGTRAAFIGMMAAYEPGDQLDRMLEARVETNEMSLPEAKSIFADVKGCAFRDAL